MKNHVSIIAAAMLSLGLTACGGSGGETTPSASSNTDTSNGTTQASGSGDITIKVLDGYVVSANVRDALGKTAIEVGDGLYTFEGGATYPLIASGGKYKDTGAEFDIAMVAYDGEVISPITTIVANGTDTTLLNAFASALGTPADLDSLAVDYADTNNTSFAKAAQMAYLLIKDGNVEEFKTQLSNSALPTNVNELIEQNQLMIANSNMTSIEKAIKNNYLKTLQSSTVGGAEFEAFIGNQKYNLSKIGDNDDYDGDGLSNKLEVVFGLDLTDPTDINGFADTDDDGVSNAREMMFAFEEACGTGYELKTNYDSSCLYKYDEYNQYVTGWAAQETEDGLIVSVQSNVADEFGVPYLSIADDAGSVTLKTYDEAQTYCQNLEFGGHNDWRLPTKTESDVIFGSSTQGMGNQYGVGYKYFNPFLHTDHIMNAAHKQHDGESFLINAYKETRTWIDQEYDADNAYATSMWRFNLDLSFMGNESHTPKSYTHNSICIRTYN